MKDRRMRARAAAGKTSRAGINPALIASGTIPGTPINLQPLSSRGAKRPSNLGTQQVLRAGIKSPVDPISSNSGHRDEHLGKRCEVAIFGFPQAGWAGE